MLGNKVHGIAKFFHFCHEIPVSGGQNEEVNSVELLCTVIFKLPQLWNWPKIHYFNSTETWRNDTHVTGVGTSNQLMIVISYLEFEPWAPTDSMQYHPKEQHSNSPSDISRSFLHVQNERRDKKVSESYFPSLVESGTWHKHCLQLAILLVAMEMAYFLAGSGNFCPCPRFRKYCYRNESLRFFLAGYSWTVWNDCVHGSRNWKSTSETGIAAK